MGQYNRSNSISDSTDPNNLLLLREDLHSAFDNKVFILVPKQGRQVLHFIGYTEVQNKSPSPSYLGNLHMH